MEVKTFRLLVGVDNEFTEEQLRERGCDQFMSIKFAVVSDKDLHPFLLKF